MFSPKGPHADATTEQDVGVAKPLEPKGPKVRGGVCEINPKLGVQMAIKAHEIAQGLPSGPPPSRQPGEPRVWNDYSQKVLDIQAALAITCQAFRGLKINGASYGLGGTSIDPYSAACNVREPHLVRKIVAETIGRLRRLGFIAETL